MTSDPVLTAISAFGAEAKSKLNNPAVTGEPEDQLRGPLEVLLKTLAGIGSPLADKLAMVGESSIAELKSRPDYAVTVANALVGFIEVKAPGKGSDPRRFKDKHDKGQWEKLRSLPNLLYTDGESFGLWRNGEHAGLVRLEGDIQTAGAKLSAPPSLLPLIRDFLGWQPIPPRSPKDLAQVTARLCRLLRDEVTEELAGGLSALTALGNDWRTLLFPDAGDAQFADGYAQAVTFGLLMARSRSISLAGGLDAVAKALGPQTLIGVALRLLTEESEVEAALKTSLRTLTRVLDAVDWSVISKGESEAWLYFYEAFLEVYDNDLRKKTGSYYTPPEVVSAMVRLADTVLIDRFDVPSGFASSKVTVADPAVGSGTFLLGVLRSIADTVRSSQGEGAIAAAVQAATKRLIGFEIQFGPFAVAQLRLFAELVQLEENQDAAHVPLRLFVTDTLGDPNEIEQNIPGVLKVLSQSRAEANKIKAHERITVVIGNPPYKEKAKGRGGWVENGKGDIQAPLEDWMPPREWRAGAHSKHLRNLYIYFWRWAAWKVFGPRPNTDDRAGIVCFITVAGFLKGEGFQKMRDDLRRSCDAIWVIDCTPEGLMPEVNTRIFQDVKHTVCIVLAARTPQNDPAVPARVHFRSLPKGRRKEKFQALASLSLDDTGWVDAAEGWREPFLAAPAGAWAIFPKLAELVDDAGPGVMPGRTWVIAPDTFSLGKRWEKLIREKDDVAKEKLFHPQLRDGKVASRHIRKFVTEHLGGYKTPTSSIAQETNGVLAPIRYAFRSFDRQWLIPDSRLLNDPRPQLWPMLSTSQIFITIPVAESPSSGPAITFTSLIPDQDHYAGRGGRVYGLYSDAAATSSNLAAGLLDLLTREHGVACAAEDVFAYIAALVAHPTYVQRFRADLASPGLRVPLTADPTLFSEASSIGREVIWLHTYGERFIDPAAGRSHAAPRMPAGQRPTVPKAGAIPGDAARFPDTLEYDPAEKRLHVGEGFIDNVSAAVWDYTVSGKHVVQQWFSYRKKDRKRPIIGDRRPPSPLGDIQPDGWPAEYTEDLIDLLNVLGRLVALEPAQADLLGRICAGPLIDAETVAASRPPPQPYQKVEGKKRSKVKVAAQDNLI
jgi:hypothetical protein